jgi:hypothetical protein
MQNELGLELFEMSQLLGMRALYDAGQITKAHMLRRVEELHEQTLHARRRLSQGDICKAK